MGWENRTREKDKRLLKDTRAFTPHQHPALYPVVIPHSLNSSKKKETNKHTQESNNIMLLCYVIYLQED